MGGHLLKTWNLPIPIVEAVSYHHQPEQSPNAADLASITHLASYLSHLHSFKEGKENVLMFLLGQAMRQLKGKGNADQIKAILIKKLR